MVFPRKLYPALLDHAKTELVTVLTGMRRTGKTTLLRQLIEDLPNKNSIYLDLQRPDNREIFQYKNYDSIRDAFVARGLSEDLPMVVFLDEIQLVPESAEVIKYLYDHYKIKFVVTGSSSYYLKNLFSESLAGRKKLFELFPLDFGEFLSFKGQPHSDFNWDLSSGFATLEYSRLLSYYDEFIRFGGFPQVVLAQSDDEKKDILLDIMSSYVNIDIRSLADFSDERNLYSLAKLLASMVGSRVEYSNLSRVTGISRVTVANYISFFEKTYLIRTVGVYTKNTEREIVKSRKLYFCDTGLANVLSDLSSGAQFENTLFNQLARVGEVSYFALKNGQEIDFILNGQVALEAKETPTTADDAQLKKMAEIAGLSKTKLVGKHSSPKFEDFIWGGSIV